MNYNIMADGQHRLLAAKITGDNITSKQILDLQRNKQNFYVVFLKSVLILITTDEDTAVEMTVKIDNSQLYIVKDLFTLTTIFNKREYEYET